MTLTEAQVEEMRAALTGNRMVAHKAGEQHIADALTRALDYQMNALCDLALAQIRGREQEPFGWLEWPSMKFKINGSLGVFAPVSVKADPIPVYAAPQPAPGMLSVPVEFQKPRFGAFRDDGTFEEFPQTGWETHPKAWQARWVGGEHDIQTIKAAMLAAQGGTK